MLLLLPCMALRLFFFLGVESTQAPDNTGGEKGGTQHKAKQNSQTQRSEGEYRTKQQDRDKPCTPLARGLDFKPPMAVKRRPPKAATQH
jgi:hypothetical protein